MKVIIYALLGLIGGFIGGIILSEIIAITAHLIFDDLYWLRGLKYTPFILAIGGAVIVPIWFESRKQTN